MLGNSERKRGKEERKRETFIIRSSDQGRQGSLATYDCLLASESAADGGEKKKRGDILAKRVGRSRPRPPAEGYKEKKTVRAEEKRTVKLFGEARSRRKTA